MNNNTHKAKVLRIYPEAYCQYNQIKSEYVIWDKMGSIDKCTVLGRGQTVDFAWIGAESTLINNLNNNSKR
jgi:hypothetical protein